MTNKDCCEESVNPNNSSEHLTECLTHNHDTSITPDNTEATCFEWCCQDD